MTYVGGGNPSKQKDRRQFSRAAHLTSYKQQLVPRTRAMRSKGRAGSQHRTHVLVDNRETTPFQKRKASTAFSNSKAW